MSVLAASLTASFVATAAVVAAAPAVGLAGPNGTGAGPTGTVSANAESDSRQPSWRLSPPGSPPGFAACPRSAPGWPGPAAARARSCVRSTAAGAGGRSARPATAELQFRDIEAFDARHAVALAIGEGDQSRLYRTATAGAPGRRRSATTTRPPSTTAWRSSTAGTGWRCPTRSTASSGSWPPRRRPVLAGAADRRHAGRAGRRVRLRGQRHLPGLRRPRRAAAPGSPPAAARPPGCSATANGGRTWTVTDTPVPSGADAPASTPWRSATRGTASRSAATSPRRPARPDARRDQPRRRAHLDDRRRRCPASTAPARPGCRAPAAPRWRSGRPAATSAATAGRTWRRFDTGSFDAVDCAPDGACWASGETGRVAVLRWR